MKKLVILFTLVAFAFSASAQNTNDKKTAGTSLSVGAEVGIPTGDLEKGWGVGFGGSAKAAFNIAENGFITVSAGYLSFSGKNSAPAYNLIPLKAGFRYSFGGFYVEPQVGYSIAKVKGFDSEGAFTYAPNIGYMINNMVDISARYEAATKDGTTVSHIGFRVAYNFSLGGK